MKTVFPSSSFSLGLVGLSTFVPFDTLLLVSFLIVLSLNISLNVTTGFGTTLTIALSSA